MKKRKKINVAKWGTLTKLFYFVKVCNVVTEGNFCGKTSSVVSLSDGDKKSMKELNFRKPVGVAAVEITDLFTFKQGKAALVCYFFNDVLITFY